MWESPSLPFAARPYLDSADLVIVPTVFCVDLLAPYVRCPIVIVPLGIDAARWPFEERSLAKGESFQWLLVGAANARKGFDVLELAWHRHFLDRDDTHLYLKTTGPRVAYEAALACEGASATGVEGVVAWRNIILDFRNLPQEALRETYRRSQGFAFPTAGEGWGLTLMEAMATGLPAVVTRWSGVLDFTSEQTVRYVNWTPHDESYHDSPVTHRTGDLLKMTSAWVDPDELAQAMREVMTNYAAARRRARRGAAEIRSRFTWPMAGEALARVLARFAEGLDPTA
jgi:glycosyltransferase involved in cell wall biosynthesis